MPFELEVYASSCIVGIPKTYSQRFHSENPAKLPVNYNGPPVKTTLEKNIVNYGALNGSGAYVRYAALVTAKLAAYTSSGVA